MTPDEITIECEYRRAERLGILCGPIKPSANQIALADSDAMAFRVAVEPKEIESVKAVEQSAFRF